MLKGSCWLDYAFNCIRLEGGYLMNAQVPNYSKPSAETLNYSCLNFIHHENLT